MSWRKKKKARQSFDVEGLQLSTLAWEIPGDLGALPGLWEREEVQGECEAKEPMLQSSRFLQKN